MLSEQEKYQKVWDYPQYRLMAPGEVLAGKFIQLAEPKVGELVYDFGCGTGRGALKIAGRTGAKVVAMDFADNALDKAVKISEHAIEFKLQDLTKPIDGPVAKYGYCTDVMEHIPPEQVDAVIDNITQAARKVFFGISCVDDVMGALIGEPLHLSVHPASWWHEKLESRGIRILYEEDAGDYCYFWVTRYLTGKDIKINLNVEESQIYDNVLLNMQADLRQIEPCKPQDIEVMLLGGGPSLREFEDLIREKRNNGTPLITTNGAYNWCLQRGIKPSAQIVLDSREFNSRFVQPIVPGCRYLLASQVHPNVVKLVPREQIWLWHSGSSDQVLDAVKEYADQTEVEIKLYPIYGGPTVMLRAFTLLMMLGFTRFHVFGFDSCLGKDGVHHAYPQPENDTDQLITVNVGDKEFVCHGDMFAQAQQFLDLQPMIAENCQMIVYGDGLIAQLIKTGAEMARKLEE